jgi:hypothetical protein
LTAQPYASSDVVKIYSADDLINTAKTKGFKELQWTISPIDLVYVDSTYAQILIDLEFKFGFSSKHYDNNKIITYELPELTLDLADNFNNRKAGKKLFDYYCTIPKHCKADTIYYIYNNLDDYLKVLVKFSSPQLIERLKQDYNTWTKLAQKSPQKSYPTIEEMSKTSVKESMKFKTSDLYVDCNFIALQIAGALNYLKVKGFDNSLIEKLKTTQTYPYANRYSFPKPIIFDSKANYNSSKTIQNLTGIGDFRKDYKKVEKLIFDNFGNCCDSKIYEIIEKGSKAYISVSRNNGYDFYTVRINKDNSVVIDKISSIIE